MNHVAVLGAGIMGTATALLLARRGVGVTLIERSAQPMSGASRWNEGKIHLGYLYAGDRTLATARRVVAGGVAFRALMEDLLGLSLAPAIGGTDDVYAIHRDSVVAPDDAAGYYAAVATVVAEADPAGAYLGLGPAAPPRPLSAAERARHYGDHVVAAFQVGERSVSTTWIADRLVEALAAAPRIALRTGVTVLGVHSRGGGQFDVVTPAGIDGPYDAVVNALWDGRLAVDASMGLAPPTRWSHRYRLAAFVTTPRAFDLPSTVVATGPFGDVKNYGGCRFYVSWYPAGLVAEGHEIAPPPVPAPDPVPLFEATIAGLATLVPAVGSLAPFAAQAQVAGGWVFAAGDGSLADPAATLHRRDRIGLLRHGRYVSVDTGKYSIAPWLAHQVADVLL